MNKRGLPDMIKTWIAFLVVVLLPLAAHAQAETRVRETIPAGPFLAAAYGFIWAAVLVYVIMVARRLAKVKEEMEDLRRKVERGS
jgi:CcmD family protein